MPSEPVSIAATSESMSPKRLSVTMTSNCLGAADELHAAGVGEHVGELDVGEAGGVGGGDDLVPEDAGLHDVALLHRADAVRADAGELEGDGRDALDLEAVVDLGVDGALLAVAEVGDRLRLAEVDAAGELADDEDVEALDELALERGEVGEGVEALRRAEVGEELEVLAEAEEAGLGADVVGHLVPLRAADRREEDGVGGLRLLHRRVGDRLAVGVVGAAADELLLDIEGTAVARRTRRRPCGPRPSPRGRCRLREGSAGSGGSSGAPRGIVAGVR